MKPNFAFGSILWYNITMKAIHPTKEQFVDLAKKHSLDFVVLFGSHARGHTHEKSDVDIAVISREKLDIIALMMDLYDLFKREDVEVVNLATASPTLCRAVSRDGVLLHETTAGAYSKWRLYSHKIWMETAWLRKIRDQKLIRIAEDYRKTHA